MADTGSLLDHGLGREHLVPRVPSSHPRAFAQLQVPSADSLESGDTPPGRQKPEKLTFEDADGRHHHLAVGPGVRLVNIGLRALPLRHPWKQRRQRPFVGLLKLPQLQGRGTVPNTWASATAYRTPHSNRRNGLTGTRLRPPALTVPIASALPATCLCGRRCPAVRDSQTLWAGATEASWHLQLPDQAYGPPPEDALETAHSRGKAKRPLEGVSFGASEVVPKTAQEVKVYSWP